ncbi:hypothetical protein QTP88_024072 [Uroleucon formosanum]
MGVGGFISVVNPVCMLYHLHLLNAVQFLKNSERIRFNTSKRRQLFPEKRKVKKSKTEGEDEQYGLAEPLIEFFSSKEMENKKIKFLEKLGRADYGREIVTKARQKFEQLSKEKVYENGLIIDPEFPFLAASPEYISKQYGKLGFTKVKDLAAAALGISSSIKLSGDTLRLLYGTMEV